MDQRTVSRSSAEPFEGAPPQGPLRLAVGRIRLRSLARVGFSIGWIISFLPSLLFSAGATWVLHGIWSTLDGWTPWTPWARDTRIAGFTLPTPEFRPREALQVEGLYQLLEPVGRHPLLGALLGTLVLTVIGGALVALTLILAGAGYNLFARFTGGIEFELTPHPAPARQFGASHPQDSRVRAPNHGDALAVGRAPRPVERGTGSRRRRHDREDEGDWSEDVDLKWEG